MSRDLDGFESKAEHEYQMNRIFHSEGLYFKTEEEIETDNESCRICPNSDICKSSAICRETKGMIVKGNNKQKTRDRV